MYITFKQCFRNARSYCFLHRLVALVITTLVTTVIANMSMHNAAWLVHIIYEHVCIMYAQSLAARHPFIIKIITVVIPDKPCTQL